MLEISEIRAYESCNLIGEVLRLSLSPTEGIVSAWIGDRTGELRAAWHLIRPTPQLELSPGTWVVLSGVPRVDVDGALLLWEPDFTVSPAPSRADA